jgi:hypothetical protein
VGNKKDDDILLQEASDSVIAGLEEFRREQNLKTWHPDWKRVVHLEKGALYKNANLQRDITVGARKVFDRIKPEPEDAPARRTYTIDQGTAHIVRESKGKITVAQARTMIIQCIKMKNEKETEEYGIN